MAEAREREAMHRADRRQAEEALAQMTARRNALEELERDRVGLAPAAAALLAARDRFDGGVLGPLSDYVSIGREDAELAERLLGDWMHAVLVRDGATVQRGTGVACRRTSPGRWSCCRSIPGPQTSRRTRCRWTTGCGRKGPRAGWVRAALAGSEVLDPSGRVLRRASGAIFLSGSAAPSGPLRRRAELGALAQDVERAGGAVAAAAAALRGRPSRVSPSGSAPSPMPCRPPSRLAKPSGWRPPAREDLVRLAAQPDPRVRRLRIAARPPHRAARAGPSGG